MICAARKSLLIVVKVVVPHERGKEGIEIGKRLGSCGLALKCVEEIDDLAEN